MRKSYMIAALLLAAILVGTPALTRADAISAFNFDSDTVGTTTQFSDTNGGLTAIFSSVADPGGFAISSNTFAAPMSGNVLLSSVGNIPLEITFSQPLYSITLDFAIEGPNNPFTLSAFEIGAGEVGFVNASGVSVPTGYAYPQGSVTFTGYFDSIVLTPDNNFVPLGQIPDVYFAIDNIVAIQAPEPSSLVLLSIGLAGLVIVRRKNIGHSTFPSTVSLRT